jgi:glycosyltransferase involved in cell wall biosynthesis
LKILLLAPCPFYQNRGTPIAIHLAARVLGEAGHRIHILTYPEGESVSIPNGSISRVPALPGIKNIKPGPSWKKLVYDLVMCFTLIKLVRKNRFDVIHAVEESAFMALALKKIVRLPFVYDLDSSLSQQIGEKYRFLKPLTFILQRLERKVIRESEGAIAVCRALEEEVRQCAPDKLVCRLEDISLLSDPNGKTNRPAVKTWEEPVIMYVGNLEKYQGIDLLLEGFQKAQTKTDSARLVIIGGAEPDIKSCRKRSVELGLGKKVDFLGPKPLAELPYWLAQAAILVSPRIKGNNTPMKIYSYLDSGKPVLATRLPTHTQVLDDRIAFLVDPTPDAISEGLVTLLEDGAMRDRLAQAARKRVQEEYCLESYQKKLLHFYDRLEEKLSSRANKNLAN